MRDVLSTTVEFYTPQYFSGFEFRLTGFELYDIRNAKLKS
jgi:hypothetical protein